MVKLIIRLSVCALTFMLGISIATWVRLFDAPPISATQTSDLPTSYVANIPTDDDPDFSVPSEIQIERINSGCIDCNDHSIAVSRTKGNKFTSAVVVYTDLHTKKQRHGELSAYYYNRLLQLAKSERLMEMSDEYAMGWDDALIVKMTISIGDRRKTIRTQNEGEVPLNLWGFYMAIDGAVAHAEWTTPN